MFHVSQLKARIPNNQGMSSQLPAKMIATPTPQVILDRRTVKRGNIAATKVLVQWEGEGPEAATWEFAYDLQKKFPTFDLEARS